MPTASSVLEPTPDALPLHQRGALPPEMAAQYVGYSPATLRNFRSRGRGPRYIKDGRKILYRVSDLDAYLSALSSGGGQR